MLNSLVSMVSQVFQSGTPQALDGMVAVDVPPPSLPSPKPAPEDSSKFAPYDTLKRSFRTPDGDKVVNITPEMRQFNHIMLSGAQAHGKADGISENWDSNSNAVRAMTIAHTMEKAGYEVEVRTGGHIKVGDKFYDTSTQDGVKKFEESMIALQNSQGPTTAVVQGAPTTHVEKSVQVQGKIEKLPGSDQPGPWQGTKVGDVVKVEVFKEGESYIVKNLEADGKSYVLPKDKASNMQEAKALAENYIKYGYISNRQPSPETDAPAPPNQLHASTGL